MGKTKYCATHIEFQEKGSSNFVYMDCQSTKYWKWKWKHWVYWESDKLPDHLNDPELLR